MLMFIDMLKRFVLFSVLLFGVKCVNAQFLGGGSGTIDDPYQIWNVDDWNEFAAEFNSEESVYGDFTGIHLRIMNSIADTINTGLFHRDFNGSIHGGGHSLRLYMTGEQYFGCFLNSLGAKGYVDSLIFTGKCEDFFSVFSYSHGHIFHCSSNMDCSSYDPSSSYLGVVMHNYGVIEYCNNYTEVPFGAFYGICYQNFGIVDHCVNYADFKTKAGSDVSCGIAAENAGGIVRNCMNFGNMQASSDIVGLVWSNSLGISGHYDSVSMQWHVDTLRAVVQNCINFGSITVEEGAEGYYFSLLVGENLGSDVLNCLNVGSSSGSNFVSSFDYNLYEINTPGFIVVQGKNAKTEKCLNIGNTGDFFMCRDSIVGESFCNSNYFDKQMCLSSSIAGEYVDSIAEGRPTLQLTGDSPELRAMLG
ncbi:MAG: hypothetical protein HUK15_00085, partial [Bacteroidales bacterium]|nr:hypothetical protein [Bacteroidales bacterium]